MFWFLNNCAQQLFNKSLPPLCVFLNILQSVALEKYADNSSLGRFALRSEGLTIAVGQVGETSHAPLYTSFHELVRLYQFIPTTVG